MHSLLAIVLFISALFVFFGALTYYIDHKTGLGVTLTALTGFSLIVSFTVFCEQVLI